MSFIEITAVLGNLGEFVGAIAVVLTLFYVGLQVKHRKQAAEANTRSLDAYHARAIEMAASLRTIADSPIDRILAMVDKESAAETA
jgi:hypothetical protein